MIHVVFRVFYNSTVFPPNVFLPLAIFLLSPPTSYKKNKKWAKAIEMSKQDTSYKDAMEVANESNSTELVLELLNFFIERKDKECFTACCFNCYSLLKPDVVMELAWKNKMMDCAMPYLIQSVEMGKGF